MNFLAKNFAYKTITFEEFMRMADEDENVYLRALSTNRPADQATNLTEDFPGIAADFVLPPQLDWINERIHSMPLRISGPVTMWLHYDVSRLLTSIHQSNRANIM